MKKLGAIAMTCLLGLNLTACGPAPEAPEGSALDIIDTDPGSAAVNDPVIPEPIGSAIGSGSAGWTGDPNVRTYHDCTVTVTGYSLSTDSEGNPALRIEFLFENNSKMPASFSTTVIPNAYQDETAQYKVPLAYATPAEIEAEYSALLSLIQPGDSIICAGFYKLTSLETPVFLKVLDLRDSSAEPLTRLIEIADLSDSEEVQDDNAVTTEENTSETEN